ncbi:MAG: hypothetical protein A2X61_06490 [Ignavibacteria bacterium GWB2_35_12]|nr:MAG: hypothetical protein A2X61_06490 [Ignavibacteria bacterium GWB2_35_12]OGV19741.1 MAG: hypothetical protein A2475_00565 [Ignavibacteria bacterium RIFOXYC2_FULL_35_21]
MISKFSKEIFLFTRFLLFTLSIIGSISCSSRNENTVTFLHFFNGTQEQKAIKYLIENFESKNNCNVDVKFYDYSLGPNELISILTGNQKNDVIAFNSEWLAQLRDNGLLYDFPEEKNIDTSYYHLLIDYCNTRGKSHCLPWLVNTRLLYINRKITQDNKIVNPPLDFQQLLDYSVMINEREKYFGTGLVGPSKQAMFKNIMPLLLSFGGDLADSTGKLDLNRNNNSTGIYFYLKLSRSGLMETKREIENQFIEGHIAYCFSDLSLIQKLIEKNVLHDFMIEQIPQNGNKPGISYTDAVMLGVSSKSTKKELSLKFIKELSEWKFNNGFSKDLLKYGVPARKNYLFTFFQDSIISVISKQITNSKLAPKHYKWYDIETIIENEIEKAIYTEKSVEGSLIEAQEEITSFLKRNRK